MNQFTEQEGKRTFIQSWKNGKLVRMACRRYLWNGQPVTVVRVFDGRGEGFYFHVGHRVEKLRALKDWKDVQTLFAEYSRRHPL